MARGARIIKDEGVYHLIARGNNKKQVFETTQGYVRFKELLLISKEKFDWRIYHYCLMPNHVHILAYIQLGRELPCLMKFLLQSYSYWYRNKIEYTGYLWQGRYKSPLIENDEYLLECGRYIERNPVRAGLCARIEKYPWSSYRHYVFGQNDPIVTNNPIYDTFGPNAAKRRKNYRDFVELPVVHESLVNHAFLSQIA